MAQLAQGDMGGKEGKVEVSSPRAVLLPRCLTWAFSKDRLLWAMAVLRTAENQRFGKGMLASHGRPPYFHILFHPQNTVTVHFQCGKFWYLQPYWHMPARPRATVLLQLATQ